MTGRIKRHSPVIPTVFILLKMALVVFLSILGMLGIPDNLISLTVIEDYIRDAAKSLRIVVSIRPFPDNLISEILGAKNRIQN